MKIRSNTVVQWLALLPHSNKVLGLSQLADWGFSMWSLCVLPVLVWTSGHSGFLSQSRDIQLRSTGYSKLLKSENGCLFLVLAMR